MTKFALLWNVLQNTGRPPVFMIISNIQSFLGRKKRGGKSDILKIGGPVLSFPPFYLFPFFFTEFQIYIQKCVLWDIHLMFLNGMATPAPTFSKVSVPISINFSGPRVCGCQQISIPVCGLSWCHMTFPIFPTCKLHRMLGVGESAATERGEKTSASSSFLRVSIYYIWCTKDWCGSEGMFWHVNMLLMPNDSVFYLDVCSRGSVKMGWCAVSTIYKMNKWDLHLWDASPTFPLGPLLNPLWISSQC